jgi:DNA-3-methyladenine glycosylase I
VIEPSALPAIWRIINQVARQRLGYTREELPQMQVKQLDAPENAATVNNAQKFLEVQKEFGSFDKYIWSFVGGKPIAHEFKTIKQIPATSKESDALRADLKARGSKFVGSTICYALMQAAGLVNDHVTSCLRYRQVR